MTNAELKAILNSFPDDYPVVLVDITTDDDMESCYSIENTSVGETDLIQTGSSKTIKGIGISFRNMLNENPI
jgi:hypothetical protein